MSKDLVVYILGAGFSAPLGIPVMSEFYTRSQDLYARNPKEYRHFMEVFEWVRSMASAKNYFETNLFNIEEILSILEMEDYARGGSRSRRKAFVKYIADVVVEFTPDFPSIEQRQSVDLGMFTGSIDRLAPHILFTGGLFNATVRATDATGAFELIRNESDIEYAVITLNYDMALESALGSINRACAVGPALNFVTESEAADYTLMLPNDAKDGVPLAKLHGSVDNLSIVPPTWRKGEGDHLREAWSIALSTLKAANHIRIIGYSLPPTDTYFRYLLLKAATVVERLKSIHVMCWDPTGAVKARYDSFMTFERYKFLPVTTEEYLRPMVDATLHSTGRDGRYATMSIAHLEQAHAATLAKNVA